MFNNIFSLVMIVSGTWLFLAFIYIIHRDSCEKRNINSKVSYQFMRNYRI